MEFKVRQAYSKDIITDLMCTGVPKVHLYAKPTASRGAAQLWV